MKEVFQKLFLTRLPRTQTLHRRRLALISGKRNRQEKADERIDELIDELAAL